MVGGVLDTHTILWFLSGDLRLSIIAKDFITNSRIAGNDLAISSITLIEMVYLIEKGRVPADRFTEIVRMVRQPTRGLVEIPVDIEIARTLSRIDVSQVADMPDRIIAATALYLQVPILSKDRKIQLSNLTTIW